MAKKQNPETVEQTETVETQQPKITDFISFMRELEKHKFIIELLDGGKPKSAHPISNIVQIRFFNENICHIVMENGYNFGIRYGIDIAFCD